MIKKLLCFCAFFMLLSTSVLAQQDRDIPVQKKEVLSPNDQVIADDLIVTGSIAVGFDAVNGESFGFDTFRLKENNLRIHFDDTSASGSFPSNDWRITINDNANGGANYFGIDDATANRSVFKILAGAPSNSFYMKDNGYLGLGTASPVTQFHIAHGNTPTMRLEQNGAAGFASQTWDVAGNETNFFIRDATNGSTLPFRIKAGAPGDALYIAADGNIGLGTDSPLQKLDVRGNAYVKDNLYVGLEISAGSSIPNENAALELTAADKGLLLNRLTTANRTALEGVLVAADIGLMVYDTDEMILYVWNGTVFTSSTLGDLETRVANLETAAQASVLDKTPQKFNYQTSLVDTNGEPIMNQSVNFKISVLKGTAAGTVAYEETHNVTTTSKGLTDFKIGNGTVVSGVFADVNWAEDEYFLKVEADVTGGTTYQDFGTTQLISVPYALHAKTADKLTGNLAGNLAKSADSQQEELLTLKKEIETLKKTVESLMKMQQGNK
ncbi:hypothetical protein [Polaribacter sp.]|uniref:hypothetical protein n=1 Tax=Polaribacter sp. TaxID=1920175 RepID=UPI003EF625E9